MSQVPNLDKQISHYLSSLSEKKKKAVLTVVKTFAEEQEQDLWNELPDEIKASVLIGLEESKTGDGKTHSQMMKKYSKWLKR